MQYIWLDDMRQPPKELKEKYAEFAISYYEAIDIFLYLESKYPSDDIYIDFDHDLSSKKSGYDFAKWLVEHGKTGYFHVHSMNPVGAANIRQLLTHYGWKEIQI